MAISLMMSACWATTKGEAKASSQTTGSQAFQRDASSRDVRTEFIYLPPCRTNRPCGRQMRMAIISAVDDERAQLGNVVLARHIGNAQQQGGQQRAR
jgi:hypothetical protein